MRLHGLGYLGLTAPDPAAMLPFWTEVIGMMPARFVPGEPIPRPGTEVASGGSGTAPDGSTYLKMDDYGWRIGVHPGDKAGIAYLGFEVSDLASLDDAMKTLDDAGVRVARGSAEDTAARGVRDLIWCEDPCGNRVEIFSGPAHDRNFVSPTGVQFLTGGLGLGHVLMFAERLDASLDFYVGALGFTRSDFFDMGDGKSAHFLRCTRRHHTVALMHVGPFSGLHHLMVEVTSLDQVGGALDRANDAGLTITSSLGRHLNDRAVSFYMRSPAGFEVEVGWDGVLVDDDWCDRQAGGAEIWGTAAGPVRTWRRRAGRWHDAEMPASAD